MNILTNAEEITKKLHLRLSQLSITMCGTFVILVLIDIKYGFFSQMPIRSASGIGKMTGSVALLVGGVVYLYYVLREAFVQSKRKNISFHAKLGNSIKKSIQIIRYIHPICGLLVFFLVLGHTYILWYVVGKIAPRVIYSGLFALISLALVTAMGIYIVYKPKYLQMRKYHRILTGLLILFVVMHLIVR
jgi:hypothetical protein